jgi:ribosomal protein S3
MAETMDVSRMELLEKGTSVSINVHAHRQAMLVAAELQEIERRLKALRERLDKAIGEVEKSNEP